MSTSIEFLKGYFKGISVPLTAIAFMTATAAVYVGMVVNHPLLINPARVWLFLANAFLAGASFENTPVKWMAGGFAVALVVAAGICVIF